MTILTRSTVSAGVSAPLTDDDPWIRSAPATTSNRELWEAANAPALPPLSSNITPLAPIPGGSVRILRRPSPSSGPASGSSTPNSNGGCKPVKSLSEREEEYRRARERIFAEDNAKEEEKRKESKAEKPRDKVDEVIRAAEAMALAAEAEGDLPGGRGAYGNNGSSSRGGRGRGRGKANKQAVANEDDDFETRTDLATRSSSIEALYSAGYGVPMQYFSGPLPPRIPSRSGSSGTTSPIYPGLLYDPTSSGVGRGAGSGTSTPTRSTSQAGISRQPRGPVSGEGAGFAAVRSSVPSK